MHYGTDFDADRGSPVWAAHQGVVETATYMKDFGRVIVLNHGDGFSTLYAHLNKIRVKYGETVRQGQRIGDVGSSGLSTGPHLHFEMRIDHVLRNPKKYLPYKWMPFCSLVKRSVTWLRWRRHVSNLARVHLLGR